MLSEITQYMHENNIKVTQTNYKLELLNFIAENYNNGIGYSVYLEKAQRLLIEEHYKKVRRGRDSNPRRA